MKAKFLTLALACASCIAPAMAQQSPMPMHSAMPMHSTMPMASSMPMNGMQMDGPAHFAPTTQAYTTNHALLIKLTTIPKPIPYQQYFTLRFAVFDPQHPNVALQNATFTLFAGMRHGLKTGFAHGMNSTPKIVGSNGTFTVSGMYFHMMGAWTLKVTAAAGGKSGVAYFQLPCCGQ